MEAKVRDGNVSEPATAKATYLDRTQLRRKARIVELWLAAPVILIGLFAVATMLLAIVDPSCPTRPRGVALAEASLAYVRREFGSLIAPDTQDLDLVLFDPGHQYRVFRYRPAEPRDGSIDFLTRHAAASGWIQVGESYNQACLDKAESASNKTTALVSWRRGAGVFEVYVSRIRAHDDSVEFWRMLGHRVQSMRRPNR